MSDRHGPVLGRRVSSPIGYTPDLLQPIERAAQRRAAGLEASRFRGEDVWRCHEMSWLNARGRPVVSPLAIRIPCTSPATVESKSLKLYLNAFAQERVAETAGVLEAVAADLGRICRAPVTVTTLRSAMSGSWSGASPGCSLDDLDLAVDVYQREPSFLAADGAHVSERLFTHLFASVCPVTGQPDWGSLFVEYSGPRLERDGLLRYLVSYRRHGAFHETIVEQVFTDVMTRCACERLTVHACFQRRGGIDINPFRSTDTDAAPLR